MLEFLGGLLLFFLTIILLTVWVGFRLARRVMRTARGFAAGVCCVVSDTGAYSELPREAVLHVPLAGATRALAEALAALVADPAGLELAVRFVDRVALPDDLAGYELEAALHALAELTGRDVQEDVVDAVFRNFCVGK